MARFGPGVPAGLDAGAAMTIFAILDDQVDALAQYRHDMAVASAPMAVRCPSCYAARGDHCRSSFGNRVPFHPKRRAAVELLTDDEKVAAVEALRVERHRAATVPPLVLTPQQAVCRATTAAAWDELQAATR